MKKKVLAVVVGVGFMVAACGGGGDSNAWPEDQQKAFTSACQKSGGTKDQCTCALHELEKIVDNGKDADKLTGKKRTDATNKVRDACT